MDKWVVSFIAGCISTLIWTELPPAWMLPVCFVAALTALRWRYGPYVSGLIFGTLWMASVGHSLITWQLSLSQIDELDRVKGTVIDATVNAERSRFTMRVDSFKQQIWWQHWLPSPTVRLSWKRPCRVINKGDIVSARVRLKPVHGLANQGGFNYQVWLRSEGINATGFVVDSCALEVEYTAVTSVRERLLDLVASFELEHDAIIRALSLGDRVAFTPALWTALQKTGLSHLIAISGLHLTVVAGVCVFCVSAVLRFKVIARRLRQRFDGRPVVVLVTVTVCFYYATLSGLALPVTRAWIALACLSALVIWRRHWTSVRVWLYCVWILLCIFPLSILSASFWLSVLAVGYILFLNWVIRLRKTQISWLDRTMRLMVMQSGLCLLMIPLTAYFFSTISIVAVMINLIAIPLVTLVLVPLCLVATVFASLGGIPGCNEAAYWIFVLIDFILGLLMPFVYQLSMADLVSVSVPDFPLFVWLLALTGVVLCCLPIRSSNRALAVVLLLPMLSHLHTVKKPEAWSIDVLDVGQGLAVVITKNGQVLLYDVGAHFDTGFNMAEAVIAPLLASRGVRKIEEVFISHYDNDHAGSLNRLREVVSVNVVSDNSNRCVAGERHWQGLTLTILWPLNHIDDDENSERNRNSGSCVLKVSDGHSSVLLPGDIGKAEELELVARYNGSLSSTVLVAPHHGSNTSSTGAFIKSVNPEIAVFSQGFRNRWRFPAQEVVNRYVAEGVELLATSESGQIHIEFSAGKASALTVKTYRQELLPFWYANDY